MIRVGRIAKQEACTVKWHNFLKKAFSIFFIIYSLFVIHPLQLVVYPT